MSTQQQQQFLIAYTVDRMTEFFMEDYGSSIPEALNVIYNSDTYRKLTETDNELYSQSPSYVYEVLIGEYKQKLQAIQ